MGKNIISQRRGRGSPTYRVPASGKRYKPKYIDKEGKVTNVLHDRGRDSPIIEIRYDDGSLNYMVAPKGTQVGDTTSNIGLPLSQIPEGAQVFAIETYPNSGPKLCMSPGVVAVLLSKDEKQCVLKLPSRKERAFSLQCRATLGTAAGEGRRNKPFIKAGAKYHLMHARGKLYPRTSATSMNAVDHPFGGSTNLGNKKTVSRHRPPGAKVGSIAARRTGKRK